MGWLCATYLHERLRRQPACAGDEAAEKEMETKGRAADQGEKHVPVPEILVHAVAGAHRRSKSPPRPVPKTEVGFVLPIEVND